MSAERARWEEEKGKHSLKQKEMGVRDERQIGVKTMMAAKKASGGQGVKEVREGECFDYMWERNNWIQAPRAMVGKRDQTTLEGKDCWASKGSQNEKRKKRAGGRITARRPNGGARKNTQIALRGGLCK